ncbi:NAD(P)/FAD-dependent oxidoreductase [Xanthomonas massiliensis]|uniref:NAD(P)/FAD-dependent oxidoreductase n=1 Tax=Xanthomonas massiliensis TaxID=1720302 RepID=UPI0008240005|nr:FAD-dependent oxidoreductase [Xanthomonas massiliensis]
MNVEVYDFAIIGAGMAGASLGYYLARHGTVVVLEREIQPGYHSTGRSAAMFMESYGSAQIRALTRASRAFYETPPAGFSEHPILLARGCLYVALQGQDALLEAAAADGRGLRRLGADQVLARVPCLDPGGVIGGLEEPDAREFDVAALHQGYLRGMRALGGRLRCEAQVVAARRQADHWCIALSNGEQLLARYAINAAGAWADPVAELFGARALDIQPRRRSAFTFDTPPGIDCSGWPMVVGIDESFYFKPDAGLLLGSPANAEPTRAHDVMPEDLDIAIAIDHIERATTLSIHRPRHCWAGLRSFARDGEMVIGPDPQVAGLFWLAGQGGYGIQSADAAARLAASLLLTQRIPEHLARASVRAASMSPDRFTPSLPAQAPA